MNWISVKDRLPKLTEDDLDCIEVLCRLKYDSSPRVLSFIISKDEEDKIESKSFYMSYRKVFDDLTEQVTHWMPLPEPPKEDNNAVNP